MITPSEQAQLDKWHKIIWSQPMSEYREEMKELWSELKANLSTRTQLADVLRYHGLPFSLPEKDDVVD